MGQGETKEQILARIGLKESDDAGTESKYVPVQSFPQEWARSFRSNNVSGYHKRNGGNLQPSKTGSEIYKEVVESICSAYESGSIPQTMLLYGLPNTHDTPYADGMASFRTCSFGELCSTCRRIAATFPVEQVVSLKRSPYYSYFPTRLGGSIEDHVKELVARPATTAVLKEGKYQQLYRDLLLQCEVFRVLYMEDGENAAVGYMQTVQDAMKELKKAGFNASTVTNAHEVALRSYEHALRGVAKSYPHYRGRNVDEFVGDHYNIDPDAYNMLVNDIGFVLDENDLNVLSGVDFWSIAD
jgi:hypothetical protein